MAINLQFQVVGPYLFRKSIQMPPSITPDSTVKEVLDVLSDKPNGGQNPLIPNFNYWAGHGTVNPQNNKVVALMYEFTSESTIPPNAKLQGDGFRLFSNLIDIPASFTDIPSNTSVIWQFYRSVTGRFVNQPEGTELTVRLKIFGQPQFDITPLNKVTRGSNVLEDENFIVDTYNLIFRQVRVDLNNRIAQEYKEAYDYALAHDPSLKATLSSAYNRKIEAM
ncbi:MAG TPA: hypothetical protein DCE41_33065 [Cytophagales bacterium]|nr:hypothetical protein [Cytophagales bacterium]HAA21411.1 hypothetical protein [Cytophagales bacterium]HAP59071.1 hypothetical protein [Cytophagales bacterium]